MVLKRPSELEMSGRDNRFNGWEVNSNDLYFSRIDINDFIFWRSYNTMPVTFAENSQVECKKHFIFDEIPETNTDLKMDGWKQVLLLLDSGRVLYVFPDWPLNLANKLANLMGLLVSNQKPRTWESLPRQAMFAWKFKESTPPMTTPQEKRPYKGIQGQWWLVNP